MRIKLFENYSPDGERLFHEISRDEWSDQFDSKDALELDYFSSSEANFFLEYFRDWLTYGSYGISLSYYKKLPHQHPDMTKVINVSRDSMDGQGFFIGKLPDEWYYVYNRYRYKFYKCDTFDGVIDCMLYCTKDIPYQFSHSMSHYKNK